MINLARSVEEVKKEYKHEMDPADGPKYPFGLSIYLNEDTMAKLGVDPNTPVGTIVNISAVAKVTGTTQREEANGEKCSTMDIQFTDMEIAKPAKTQDQVASTLYDGGQK